MSATGGAEEPDRGEDRLPLAILGGSDPRPGTLPPAGHDKRALSGPKGALLQIAGRPLIAALIDRARAAGCFGPIYVVGPAEVYEPLALDAELVDAHDSFGENVRTAVETLHGRHPGVASAFLACDVLPDEGTLREMVALYRRSTPCELFFPMVRAPERREALGTSAWKPEYAVLPEPGLEPVHVLPGHLMIADLGALRLEFLYRLFNLGYRTRNRPVEQRKRALLRGVLVELLIQDLRHLLGLRAPTLTVSVLRAALGTVRALKAGALTRARLERDVRTVLVTARHRRRHRDGSVRMPIVDALPLAIDLDTVEEAEAAGATVAPTRRKGP